MRPLRQTAREAEVENIWAERPTAPKGRATAGQGAGRLGEGERRAEGAPHRPPQTRDSARSGAASPRCPRHRGRPRDLPQSSVSSLALGMSTREYTAAKWSKLIRTTFLQTMFCRCSRAPGLSGPPPLSESSTPARLSSVALQKGTFPRPAARAGMAGERRAPAAAAAGRQRSAGAELPVGAGASAF